MVFSLSTAHTFIRCVNLGQYCVFFPSFESLILSNIINIFSCIFSELMQGKNFCPFRRFPELRNLMEFKLELCSNQITDVLCFMSPLKAFPMLRRLSMQFLHFKGSEIGKLKMKRKRAHKCLKVIEIIGFCGEEIESEFIWYIINNTVALEKIVIDPSSRRHEQGMCESQLPEFKEAARAQARQLGKSFPPGLELVIL
ncbi:hypothetical protein PTKIN_Ptkin14bG0111500 [Pterospermum kingtungense]